MREHAVHRFDRDETEVERNAYGKRAAVPRIFVCVIVRFVCHFRVLVDTRQCDIFCAACPGRARGTPGSFTEDVNLLSFGT